MNPIVLVNANAGSMTESVHEALVAIAEERSLRVEAPSSEAESMELVDQAIRDGAPAIFVAGGDGTVHAVASRLTQQFLDSEPKGEAPSLPALGVIPLGTGNDLARSLALPLSPEEALIAGLDGEDRVIDAFRVDFGGDEPARYGINVAAGGFAGAVDEAMTDRVKARLGPLAYVTGAASAVRELRAHEVRLRVDGEPLHESAINLVVANGRSCGGGFRVAPTADLEDGLLDVVIIRSAPPTKLVQVAVGLEAGRVLSSEATVHAIGRVIELEADDAMRFNIDGELLPQMPTRFSVIPGALRVRVGPEYSREPALGVRVTHRG